MISLHDATVVFSDGAPPALDRVSLTIERGAWIAVVGANGSGKTTLLAAIGGALPLHGGTIDRTGTVRTALLLQEPDNQFVATSVRHELALSVPTDVDDARRRARIEAAIARFELGALLERNPHRLSGGEKQRLALATVWLEDPDVLLLDEPLSYLDAPTRAHVIDFVRELNARGVAILWATPGGDDVSLARDAIILDRGLVTFAGAAANVRDGTTSAGDPADVARVLSPGHPRHVPRRGGPGSAPPARVPTASAGSGVVLRFDNVSFGYGDLSVLRDVTLEVRGGECVTVTGRNGSGKSTLLLLAGGALKPTAGRVVRDAGERSVLYLPQSPERLFFAETVLEEICFGLERRGATKAAARERAMDALRHVSLDPDVFASRSPFHLSAGEMRRVAFAIAMSLEPGLLLLDEPASCLDRAGREVLDEVVYSRLSAGASVVVASHEDAPNERVLTLRDGSLG